MPVRSYLSLGSTERKQVGVIVTVRELETGTRLVLHEPGNPTQALAEVCDRLDALPGEWRVICLSTPATIHRDLQGTRLREGDDLLELPERPALARVGRLDLLDASLLPMETARESRNERWHGRGTGPLARRVIDPDHDVRFQHGQKHLGGSWKRR